ncbi:MAG: oxidoreductase [Candidatus Methanoplasma sp.]|jgi:F420-non-reducing hydrogenase small subunit|nr:oxidoreductase [Candidatus Methanoplasma sp.]
MGFLDIFKKNKAKGAKVVKNVDAKADKVVKDSGAKAKAAKPAVAKAPASCAAKTATSVSASQLPFSDLVEPGPLVTYKHGFGTPPGGKIKLAIYWAAACGGCDVSILDSNDGVLTVGEMADIVMWPIAADGKEKDIEAMNDGEITVSIISGAVRNSENEHMVKLLRKKSAIVVCYGTCACFGGSPALANLVKGGKDELLDYVYRKTPSTANFQADYHKDKAVIPQVSTTVSDGDLSLPVLYDTVKTLDQVIDVDYFVPGCPPLQESISYLLKAVADFVYGGVALPPKGTNVGVVTRTLCDQCSRRKEFRRITKIVEPHEIDVDPELCLMDQGILCLGPATVGGCNARCTSVGQPCRGCYGPTAAVQEQGASALTAIASLFPVIDDDATCGEGEIIDIMSTIKDPLGYFYAFTMGKSLIKRSVTEKGGK